ncbi:ABC transporter substrate-binding protein [Halovenus halobia]|uniref:ABC transporter substrate-binding protein n=1 Tax=Halovenus halobia TaxID=3396622 RepID=UPI003F56740F
MASSEHSDDRAPDLNRRRLLAGLAASGVAATAGCFGGEQEDADPDDARDQADVDTTDIVEGGRLNFALPVGSIGQYDQAQSGSAADAVAFNTVYDGLRVTTPQGESLNWMANSFEVTDAQDVSASTSDASNNDYTEYMAEYEIASVTNGIATFELGENNLVISRHPDDVSAVGNGDLGEGDMMRLLTREEAGAAVDGGTYGTKIEASVHEGITFNNGEELTSENIVRSYDRFVGGTLEGQQFDSFLHARSTGDYSVEMYSLEPDATASVSIIPFTIFPSEHIDVPPGELDPRGGGPTPVGTGPYEVEEFEEGNQLLLSRTDNYWLEDIGLENKEWWNGPEDFPAGPVIDEINIRFQSNQSQRTAALKDGSVDVAYGLSPADQTTFQQSDQFSDYRVSAADATGYNFMQIPIEGDGPLSNQGVRQAIQSVIPRKQIVDTVEDGWASPARLPFPVPSAGPAIEGDYEEVAENADWAYPVEPQTDEVNSLVNDSGVETPLSVTIDTNSGNASRQQKNQLITGEMNETDVFEDCEVNLPADLTTWFRQTLIQESATADYMDRNATAMLGLTAGFDPDSYARGIHHPDSYNGCCNFFHPPGTFDFTDSIDEARFGLDAVTDVSARQEAYQDVWPGITETVGNTIIDYSLNVAVAGPPVQGYNAYPDPRALLTYSLHAPYGNDGEGLIAYIDREGDSGNGDGN